MGRYIALREFDDIVVSGIVLNEEVHSAKAQINRRSEIEVPELSNWQEEADSRLISHIAWAVHNGCKWIVVILNDTDSVSFILRYIPELFSKSLNELWIEYGTGEHHYTPFTTR